MSTSKVGRLLGLADSQARSEALAKVELVQGLAGNARWLYELATGAVEGDGPPCTPPNPQGLVGVDLSGPPWGSALWHPIAIWGGAAPALGNVTSRGAVLGGISSDRGSSVTLTGRVWQRPYAQLPSGSIPPYSRGLIVFRGFRETGAGNVTLTLTAWTGNRDGDGATTATGLVLPGASGLGVETEFAIPATCFLPLEGGHNDVYLRFASSVAAATATAGVSCIGVYNGVKRSH